MGQRPYEGTRCSSLSCIVATVMGHPLAAGQASCIRHSEVAAGLDGLGGQRVLLTWCQRVLLTWCQSVQEITLQWQRRLHACIHCGQTYMHIYVCRLEARTNMSQESCR